jgi:hypothetical protein
VQAELWIARAGPSHGTERFRIVIRYGYHFPVTFVEPLAPSENCSPSDAVIIVREFLKKQIDVVRSEYIRFDVLGPSPFHGDFYLLELPPPEESCDIIGFSFASIPLRGYDSLEFQFDRALYDNIDEAKAELLDELEDEAGLFYRMTNWAVRQMHSWSDLETAFDGLLGLYQAKGPRGLWGTLVPAYKRVHDVVVALSQFEGNQLWMMHDLRQEYRDLSAKEREPYLDAYLQKRMADFPSYPTKQLGDVVALLEGRRSKAVENFFVIIAAILGGIIGALVTLAITGGAGA